MEWARPDEEADVTGAWPSARSNHALAAVGADIYLFGGIVRGKGCDWRIG
jgi:hypothetical protein